MHIKWKFIYYRIIIKHFYFDNNFFYNSKEEKKFFFSTKHFIKIRVGFHSVGIKNNRHQ